MAYIACPVCGTQNDAAARFCIQCGSRLAPACPSCGTINLPEARFCANCGTNLGTGGGVQAEHTDASPAHAAAGPVAERRLVSVLFVDLVGFTTASESRDAEDTRELLTRYYDTARDIVSRYGGTIEKFIGDAVMAVWGTPSAHEDDPERAVRAALEVVNTVPRLEGASGLQARAGVLTGEAAVSIGAVGQGMVAGDLVNTASRLQSIARPGTVLVGESTFRAASEAIAFEAVGERELKGKEQPLPVWEAVSVVARRGGEGRAAPLEPPFVGRDDELQLLKDLFHATAREGKPRLVTVTGVAGIGKSRVLWEFEKYMDGVVENVFWHTGRSPSIGQGASYRALAEMVRARCGIADADDAAAARDKVRATVGRFVSDEADRRWIEPRVLGLLGLDHLPGEGRDELFAAWRTLFERMAAEWPVVLGFWDIQWADQGMLDFIEHLLAWAQTSPILVLAEARPELYDRRPDWGRSLRSATLMHLGPLAEDDMRRLLGGLVPDLPPGAMRRIVDRSEGVPLYAVETLRMLLDRGVLTPRGSHLALVEELPELAVPATLHALIAARLDSLPPDERGLLLDGSVLGHAFSRAALVAVSHLPEETVTGLLEGLVRRELLILDVDPRSSERGRYRFVQGVVRDIAYQSLSKRSRLARHLAAARFFESVGGEEQAGILASHYLAAHEAAPKGPEADALAAQARVALAAAAERAISLHDLVGALQALEQALRVTPEPLAQAALHSRAITVAGQAAEFVRAHEHAEVAAALFVEGGDRRGMIEARARQASVHHMEHHDQLAITALRTLLADAADLGPTPEIAHAQTELARALMLAGSIESVAWCDRVLEHPEVAAPDVLLEALVNKGTALTTAGRVLESEALLRGVIAIADARTNLDAGLRARNNLRVLLQWTDLRAADVLADEVLALAMKFGQRGWVVHASAAKMELAFRLGAWRPFDDAWRAEFAAGGEFYSAWFDLAANRQSVYQADPLVASRLIDEAQALPVISNSAQATTWTRAAKADALIALGRFDEAFESARQGWDASGENDLAITAGIFAAAAVGDTARLAEVRSEQREFGSAVVPAGLAFSAMTDCLAAALEGHWSEARSGLPEAERLLDEVGEMLLLARFRLAIGHLAQGRFPEAATAASEADAWFADHDATDYVAAYRATAWRVGNGAEVGSSAARPAGALRPAR